MGHYLFLPFDGLIFKEENELLSAMITIALYGEPDDIETYIFEYADLKKLPEDKYEKEISRLYGLLYSHYTHLCVALECYAQPMLESNPLLVYIDDVEVLPSSLLIGFELNPVE